MHEGVEGGGEGVVGDGIIDISKICALNLNADGVASGQTLRHAAGLRLLQGHRPAGTAARIAAVAAAELAARRGRRRERTGGQSIPAVAALAERAAGSDGAASGRGMMLDWMVMSIWAYVATQWASHEG
ncbi:hypothetical protein PRIPAC_91067 [Pristionchus pacificus]|uniref:Uncharacterized protein n=1 Tax=Pristionchus pacificus TaxID=54126 RepID=A0A2A6B5Z0_PRIPA|nr:hypothetical protein PRIPAC_91067 [Pristionchus pacificus]|eukprot:PDM61268.1 hypothetical protein PRIPAC_50710 [Pristionchus pacificus]